jgi:hypothetical protein
MSQDRDEATGQFTPSSEGLYGLEGIEADAGFISRSVAFEKVDTPESVGSDEESLRELARQKWGGRDNEPVKISVVHLDTGEPAPENLAQTTEQAASDLSNLHQWQKTELENEGLLKIAKEVDKARAEKIKADRKNADHYGLDADETLARAEEEADGTEPKAERATKDGTEPYVAPKVGELHPEVEKALKHPQVREAIQQEFGEANKVRQAYTTGLEQARVASLATLAEVVPHLMGLDPSRFEEGLSVLSQVDPPAFQQAMNILGRTHQIVQAQQATQQLQAQIQQAQMREYGRTEDARFNSMIGAEGIKQLNANLVPYLKKIGIDPQGLVHELQTNPRLRSAEAQKLVADAVAYDLIKSSAPKAIPKAVPAVVKPGIAAPKGARANESIGAARDRLSSSGSVEDALKYYQSKRKGRG